MCVCCCLLSILILLAMRITPVKLWWERVQGSFNRACQCGTDENTLVSKNSFDAGTQENRRRTLACMQTRPPFARLQTLLVKCDDLLYLQPSQMFITSCVFLMTSRSGQNLNVSLNTGDGNRQTWNNYLIWLICFDFNKVVFQTIHKEINLTFSHWHTNSLTRKVILRLETQLPLWLNLIG